MNTITANTIATVEYAKQILADINDSAMCQQPLGLNHPAWLMMHVSTTADYASNLLGGQGVCPTDWNDRADTKKPLTQNRSDYPSKEDLLKTFEAALLNALKLYQGATEEELSTPQKLGFFEEALPTVGEMATFMLVAHTNLHLGQLSAWRRAIGKGPLF
jgi:hypothetical protein